MQPIIHPLFIFAVAVIGGLIGYVIAERRCSDCKEPEPKPEPKPSKQYKRGTVGWYLECLPKPHREICLSYMSPNVGDCPVRTLEKAIGTACIWEHTPYPKYFADLYHAVEIEGRLPDPPDGWKA